MKHLKFGLLIVFVGGSAWARYLQPEPLLQNPRYVQYMAYQGHSVPAYSYALNNPIRWVDLNGLDVTNNWSAPIWVKPENDGDPLVQLPPGKTFTGPQDGFTHPGRPGRVFKTPNGTDAVCNSDGSVSTSPHSASDIPKWLAGQFTGGWKDFSFNNQHPDWNELFSKNPPRPGPWLWP